MKRIIKDYFTFSKKERVAITVLLLLIACFIAMPYLYPGKHTPPVINKALREYLAKNKNAPADDNAEEKANTYYAPAKKYKKESFPFDPNAATQDEWQRLGITERTARTILNYRAKGGRFRKAEDIRKIWGIKKEDADRLLPFVRIENTGAKTHEAGDAPQQKTFSSLPAQGETNSRQQVTVIDINTATAEEWKALPGIGEVLAKRILKFREYAGGFNNIDHVRKTYGLADSVFQRISPYLRINSQTVPKLDLNLASVYDLRRRLNLEEGVARGIIAYRKQYGPFQKITDLKNLVSDTMFVRIAALLKIDE